MKRLNQLINEMSSDIAKNLENPVNPQEYNNRGKKVAEIIENFQNEVLKQIFEMEVIENQLNQSNEEVRKTLIEQKNNGDSMQQDSLNLEAVNYTSKEKIEKNLALSKEIKMSTDKLIQSASELTYSTNQTNTAISDQVPEIYSIISKIEEIESSSKITQQSITNLSSSIQKIAEILVTVQNFYKQTQLLALNASIESARAGESGKGFAVVSNEIRNLADTSSESVDEIVAIMQSIDESILSVKNNTESEMSHITSAVNKAKEIGIGLEVMTQSYAVVESNLKEMNENLNRNNEYIDKIDSSLAETYDAYHHVEEEIQSIRNGIDNQNVLSQKIMDIDNVLSDVSKSLQILTDRFNLNLIDKSKKKTSETSNATIKILNEIVNTNRLKDLTTASHKKVLDNTFASNQSIEAIWTNNIDGEFIYSNPPAGIKNANIRDWFKESIKGKSYVSDFYISAISKGSCMTISIPLEDGNEVYGVLGVDLRVEV